MAKSTNRFSPAPKQIMTISIKWSFDCSTPPESSDRFRKHGRANWSKGAPPPKSIDGPFGRNCLSIPPPRNTYRPFRRFGPWMPPRPDQCKDKIAEMGSDQTTDRFAEMVCRWSPPRSVHKPFRRHLANLIGCRELLQSS